MEIFERVAYTDCFSPDDMTLKIMQPHALTPPFSQRTMNVSLKTQILINLIVLAIIDTVVPIPITAMVLIMVLFQKPKWFKDWVDRIYRH